MNSRSPLFRAAVLALVGSAVLAGCRSRGELVLDEGVGITAVRTACPAVGIPDYTGDVTLFSTPGARDAASIDLTAVVTNLRAQCDDRPKAQTAQVYSTISFDVAARRSDTRGARSVSLPYFVTVLRGGQDVVSKRVGTVTLNFADGQARAEARATGSATIDRAAATLPEDIRRRITRKRKAGEADAAVDPLTEPDVRAAVQRATFEVLVGFQLDQDQLAYNATR
jgi:hypothetical protein